MSLASSSGILVDAVLSTGGARVVLLTGVSLVCGKSAGMVGMSTLTIKEICVWQGKDYR